LVQIERFKLLYNHHLHLYESSSNSKGNKVIFKGTWRGSKIGYELFDQKISVKKTLSYLGGHNFLASSQFLSIFSETDAPRGELHLFFGHHKQWGPLTKMTSKLYLKCSVMDCSTLWAIFLQFFGWSSMDYF
jgi:hypothetical protein